MSNTEKISALKEFVKKSIHLNSGCLDVEVEGYIRATLCDLKRIGVALEVQKEGITDYSDLVKNAVVLNVKGQMDYNGKGDMYIKRYEKLRDTLSLSKEYKEQSSV